jgi:hypothetical protein
MDTPDFPSSSPGLNEELSQRCASLQKQIIVLLFALLVVSGTVGIYLYAQDRWTNQELQVYRGTVLAFQQKDNPRIEAFVRQLVEYGKTHPDFQYIVEKYRMTDTGGNTPQK